MINDNKTEQRHAGAFSCLPNNTDTHQNKDRETKIPTAQSVVHKYNQSELDNRTHPNDTKTDILDCDRVNLQQKLLFDIKNTENDKL